jgi:hypothetical protein
MNPEPVCLFVCFLQCLLQFLTEFSPFVHIICSINVHIHVLLHIRYSYSPELDLSWNLFISSNQFWILNKKINPFELLMLNSVIFWKVLLLICKSSEFSVTMYPFLIILFSPEKSCLKFQCFM